MYGMEGKYCINLFNRRVFLQSGSPRWRSSGSSCRWRVMKHLPKRRSMQMLGGFVSWPAMLCVTFAKIGSPGHPSCRWLFKIVCASMSIECIVFSYKYSLYLSPGRFSTSSWSTFVLGTWSPLSSHLLHGLTCPPWCPRSSWRFYPWGFPGLILT